jgi:hypothetical protein
MAHESPLDNYLVWQICKEQEDIQRKIIEGSHDAEQLKEIVEKVRRDYRGKNYGRSQKMDLLRELDSNPDYRSEIFEECSWSKETVKVEDLGTTLPRFGDLPPEAITGSLQEVVKFVRGADPEKYKNVRYIMRLKEVPELLDEFYPWVVTPGNRLAKRDRMNRVHGEKDWDITDTWGIINDGNHRTIAKILANDSEEIECYVGSR